MQETKHKTKTRVFSGVQPTGNLHLGNYLGAITKFLKQAIGLDEAGTLYGIATARRRPPSYLRH